MSKKTFTFNDETQKNSYGFYVLTSGIDTKRFESNPVCLNNHSNNTKDVLGKWKEIKKEGTLFLGVPDFDTEDTDGKEVVRKVVNGTINGCSMGLRFNPKDLKLIDGKLILTKCELMEVSIVAVPSNANSIVLYNDNEERLTDSQIQELCLSATKKTEISNNMKQITTHLQLAEGSAESAVLEAIKSIESKLSAVTTERDSFQTKYETLQNQQTQKLQAEYDAEKAIALTDGRLDADSVKHFDKSAETNLSNALDLLKTLPKRKTVKEQLGDDADSPLLKLSWEELDKQEKLSELKALDLSAFKEKYKAKFNKEYED